MPPGRPLSQVLITLRRWLADGVIAGGRDLPGEIELAKRLGIARGTLRKALATLTSEGLIAARRRGRRAGREHSGGDRAVVLIGAGSDDRGLAEGQEGAVEDACLRVLHARGIPVLLVDHRTTDPARVLAPLGGAPLGIICSQYAAIRQTWADQLPLWRASGIPLVVHGVSEDHPGLDCIQSDHEAGAFALTRALIASGRRRILPVWHAAERPRWRRQREEGHARAMAEAGLTVLAAVQPGEEPLRSPRPDPAHLERQAQAYLGFLYGPLTAADPPDALMAVNDANAAAVALACRMLGQAVHGKVAVAGFDANWDTGWEWPHLGLAPFLTVRKGNHAIGEALAELLLQRTAGRGGPQPLVRTLPMEVVRPEPPRPSAR